MLRLRRLPVLFAVATLVVLVITGVVGMHLAQPRTRLDAHSGPPCAAPATQNPVFSHVAGNHLLGTRGQVIVPYGVTLDSLSRPRWQPAVSEQEWLMKGAITQWCTNFIRLPLAPAHLLDRAPYDRGYAQTIESQVAYAASWDQNVILAAQTEWDRGNEGGPDPTQQTVRFWRVLAQIFKADPRVWFDVFDEPRLDAGDATWQVWQDGGVVGHRTYVGMQQLIDAIRAAGAPNLVFAEGPDRAGSLAGLADHQLTGPNIAYAVHAYSARTPAQWDLRFGDASATVPVLDDDWSQAAVVRGCSANAGAWVPELLAYLRRHEIGLGVSGFQPGVLLTSTQTFAPTTLPAGYACAHGAPKDAARNTEGAGQLVEQYFRAYARAPG